MDKLINDLKRKAELIDELCKHPAAKAFFRYILERMPLEQIDKMLESVTINVKRADNGEGTLEYWITNSNDAF